eukprot:6247817-Prymnesium_polylepis.1
MQQTQSLTGGLSGPPPSCALLSSLPHARGSGPQHALAVFPIPWRWDIGHMRAPLATLAQRLRCRPPSGPPRRPLAALAPHWLP